MKFTRNSNIFMMKYADCQSYVRLMHAIQRRHRNFTQVNVLFQRITHYMLIGGET